MSTCVCKQHVCTCNVVWVIANINIIPNIDTGGR